MRFRPRRAIAAVAGVALLTSLASPAIAGDPPGDDGSKAERRRGAVFFASDGLRQDAVERYAREGVMPAMRELLKDGVSAAGNGLLTEAPPNTGAGWFSLATGAWAGVHGSTNNTFHINGQPISTSTSSFGPNVLQAETLAQSAERSGLKVAQVEWAGGRSGTISGPTVDFRTFLSGRGVATNYVSPSDDAAMVASLGVQFDHPAGFAGQAPFAGATPVDATGWTNVPTSYSPAKEMRLRVIDFGVDKYGLNAYLFDSRDDGRVRYDKVLLSSSKDGAADVGVLREGEWADVKVKVADGALAGLTAGFYVKVETLSRDLSKVRLFHTSVARANASWPGWTAPAGFTGDFAEYVAQTFASSTGADFAVVEAGVVSEETYVEQGLQIEKTNEPLLRYIVQIYRPDLLFVGYPVTDEFQHQFLGLVTKKLPNGAANPTYDDANLDRRADGRVRARESFIRRAYEGADDMLRLARRLQGDDPTTFVASDHGFAPQFLAIDASKVLVDLGLLSKPQTGNCRLATGETIGKAVACWAGGTVQVYLNLAGRDPVNAALQQVLAADEARTVAAIRAGFAALADPNDWTGDGQPEGWKLVDRMFTKAEAAAIPNGPNSTADMAHPTRTGDLVVFSYPPYQFDAATPGTLVAPSKFFGQHGYVPDVQDLPSNTNMRATFIAGGHGIGKGKVTAATIDLAPTMAYLLGSIAPMQSQGRVLLEAVKGGARVKPISIVGLTDFHGQLEPTTRTYDGRTIPVGGAATLATLFDGEFARLPGPGLLLASGDNVGASPANSSLLEDMPTIDVENAWGLKATSYGNHEFDYGVERLLRQQARAKFPFLATNIVDEVTGEAPSWVKTSAVFDVNGTRVGVIGANVKNTPELVSAAATKGLKFLDEATRIKAESEKLRAQGIKVQVVVIHQGVTEGANAVDGTPPTPWKGPIVDIVNQLQDTTIDLVLAGHTHTIGNTVVGRIPVLEGLNAGASYSVAQVMVQGGDVDWIGGATRIPKTLGVAPRADVKAIVDDANAQTAVLRNKVIGTQQVDIKRDPARLAESAMGNLVADALRLKYPGVEATLTNSGGLRADINCAPLPGATDGPCEITWGEVFAVLPFGNLNVIETLTGAQLKASLENGFKPSCGDVAGGTGRSPQVSGIKVTFTCTGTVPSVTGLWKTPQGVSGPATPIGPADTIRIVTNDFMLTGGDGYAELANGTNILLTGQALLDVVVDYITANSPVTAAVEGRITRG